MVRERSKARRTKPARAGRADAGATMEGAPQAAMAPQNRGARLPKGPPREVDATKAAWTVLETAGITTVDDPKIKQIVDFHRNARAHFDEMAAGDPRQDIQTIKTALEAVEDKVTTERGEAIRKELLRTLQRNDVRVLMAYTAEIASGRTIPTGARARRGPPPAVEIEQTILFAKKTLGWGWEECAAAVHVAHGDKRSYAAVKKSFRDVDRRTTEKAKQIERPSKPIPVHAIEETWRDQLLKVLNPDVVDDSTFMSFEDGEQRELVLVPTARQVPLTTLERSGFIDALHNARRTREFARLMRTFAEHIRESGFVEAQVCLDGKNTRVWFVPERQLRAARPELKSST